METTPELQALLFSLSEEYHSYIQNDGAIVKELFNRDFQEELNKLLLKLPETRRRVFDFVYNQGLKAKDVAEILKIPQRTVESHIYLTMRYLKENIKASDFLCLLFILNQF